MSFEGILRPVQDTRDAWLFPVMAAPWRRSLSEDGILQHYPKPPMVIDAAKLQDVLDDETLHCVCNALCCDRLTVLVHGNRVIEPDAGPINGLGRDFAFRLELRPLAGRCKIEIPVNMDLTAEIVPEADPVTTVIAHQLSVLQNARGIVFRDFDFAISITIHCTSENRDQVRFLIDSILEVVKDCHGCAFVNCTSSIIVEVVNHSKVVLPDVYDPSTGSGGGSSDEDGGGPGWPVDGYSGGGGGGGGGGWGGPGWENGGYNPPGENASPGGGDQSPILFLGDVDTRVRAFAFCSCQDSFFVGSTATVRILARSSVGVDVTAAGWQGCSGPLAKLCQGDISIDALVSSAGVPYTNADGSHGISRYSLTARTEARLVAYSDMEALTAIAGTTSAKAICQGDNTPYHADPEGNVSTFTVDGAALATSVGFLANTANLISVCDATATAAARHPTAWARIAAAYRHNHAETTGNTGTPSACSSNIPQWCKDNL